MVGTALLPDNRVVVHSWVEGDRIVPLKFRETETDALAHAMWLSKHRSVEEAEDYLDDYIRRNSGPTRH